MLSAVLIILICLSLSQFIYQSDDMSRNFLFLLTIDYYFLSFYISINQSINGRYDCPAPPSLPMPCFGSSYWQPPSPPSLAFSAWPRNKRFSAALLDPQRPAQMQPSGAHMSPQATVTSLHGSSAPQPFFTCRCSSVSM